MKKAISLFAIFLLLLNFCFGQSPGDQKNGAVKITVPNHLEMTVVSQNLLFYYNQYGGARPYTTVSNGNDITIKSNVNWKLEISTNGQANLTNPKTTDVISAGLFTYTLLDIDGSIVSGGEGIIHRLYPLSPIPIKGQKNVSFKLDWEPVPVISGNLFAGDYKIDVIYTLTTQQ